MSKKSEERHKLMERYFKELKETADFVDPYVKNFIQKRFQVASNVKKMLLSRYRFDKPQLRPAQVRWGYELVGGKKWTQLIPACALVEAKDTGYYCYDDVLDLKGNPDLILLGGIFLSISYAMVGDLIFSNSKKVIQKVLEEIFRLDEDNSQAAFIDLRMDKINESLYMKKAMGYNFWEHALKIGGILGHGTNQEIANLEHIGEKIGTAYIIANDTWDFGKELEDFRVGKYTLPIIYAFKNTGGKDKELIKMLFGKNHLTKTEIDAVRRIMVKSGAIDYGKQRAQELCDDGIRILKENFSDSNAKKMLEFSTTMTQKNRYYDVLKKY